ncbi:MAG: hypothetical protein ACT4O1_06305 [Gemmatimonadota bacterium]
MGDEELLARLVRSKTDCGWEDLDRLYTSFGFDKREGGKHTLYVHSRDPRNLRATVARHRSLAIGYITTAIRLIRQLKTLEEGGAKP